MSPELNLIIAIITLLLSSIVSFLVAKVKIHADMKKWEEERSDVYRGMVMEAKLRAFSEILQSTSTLNQYMLKHADNKADFKKELDKVSSEFKSEGSILFFKAYDVIDKNEHLISRKFLQASGHYFDYFGEVQKNYEWLDMMDRHNEMVNILREEMGLGALLMEDGLGGFFKKYKTGK